MAEQSRGTRRLSELGTLMEASADAGVRWLIGSREIDPTEPGDIVLTSVQGGMDMAESERLSKRAKRGAQGAALAGRPPAKPNYGYTRSYDPDTRALKSVDIVPEEAVILREIRDRLLAHESMYRIANDLTDRGVPSPADALAVRAGREPKRSQWDPTTVRRLAVNPFYAGLRVHQGQVLDGITGMWEPIFTRTEHRRLKALLLAPERSQVKDGKVRHYLSGLATCGECGAGLRVLTNRGRYRSYVCPNRECFGVARTAAPLEAMVRDAVIALASRPAARKAVAKASTASTETDSAWKEVETLTTRLDEVREAVTSGWNRRRPPAHPDQHR